MKKVLCTLSGGSDSAYAALVAKRLWPEAEFHSIFIGYEQPEANAEMLASLRVHRNLGFNDNRWYSVKLDGLYRFNRRDRADRKTAYVPLRNLVLVSAACALAEELKLDTVVVGNKSHYKTEGDPLTYDGNRVFYKQLQKLVQSIEVTDHRIEIAPTLAEAFPQKLTRTDVYRGLWEAGFDYKTTFSCWFPDFQQECGKCTNCVEKRQIWNEYQKEVVHV